MPSYLAREDDKVEASPRTQRQRKSKTRVTKAKISSTKLSIPPFLNYMDSTNTEFLSLQYKEQAPLIRRSQTLQPFVCDLSNIETQLEGESERLGAEGEVSELRDLAFVGRSNVGKSSLINSLLGI